MTNKEISNSNPEKELIIDKSVSDDKTKPIIKKNTRKIKKLLQKTTNQTNLLMKFLMRFLAISFQKKTL